MRSKAAFIKRVRSASSGASCGRVERCWGRETVCGRASRGRSRFWQCVCRIIASSEGVEPASVQIVGLEVRHQGTGLASFLYFGSTNRATIPPVSTALDSKGANSTGRGFPERSEAKPGGWNACVDAWVGSRDAPRDRACARKEARRRIDLSRCARGERVIASRARSDPIPLRESAAWPKAVSVVYGHGGVRPRCGL